ncbi:polysaccharide deacetylase family protein [Actinoplanes sp. LDG1-06]|uniref:Polysaccharide deacetylase family protein n=1 Tax=Paractinoplanes ovalisporus TaxID=2810368 RepID=A0ABS2AQF1_9ACTN|nr:polysaccharide deacetylase family protein [Actinoplanes ovalisporus]MBM2622044.1 polysaccharide deacetylase family protein [Actinoplanes ovalisporus]
MGLFLQWREPAARALSRVMPGDVLWFADTEEPVFALTFDDGPHPRTTPQLLDVLRRHRARATFFLVGERVAAHPELVGPIVAEGHEVANHLMRDERSVLVPDDQFRRDLAETTRLLTPYGKVRWFRPGSGFYTPRMLRSAADQGLRAVLGTLVAGNTGGPGDEAIAGGLFTSIRPGSIVVLHEGTDKRQGVVATTDELLTALATRGLTAVTVSDLTG